MIRFTCFIGILFISLTFTTQAAAKEIFLTAKQITKFLAGYTMQVTETKPDKDTGKEISYLAYFGEMGAVRTKHPSGAAGNYGWSLKDNGAVCFKNNERLRRRGASCGFMAYEGDGVINFYKSNPNPKRTYTKDGKVVGLKKGKHVITITNIRKGNLL